VFNAATGQITDLPGNALASLSDNKFNNWQLGLRFDYPLGYRDAHASLRVAQLNLARSHVVLKNQERKAELFLGSLYQQLSAYHEQIKLQQNRRKALGEQLLGQFERVKIGKDPLIQLLDAQRAFTGSIQAESDAIVSYNIAISGFHLAKGTILPYNSITIADGPLPTAVAERAADHFAARAAALKLLERPAIPAAGPEPGVPMPLPGVADCPPPTNILNAPQVPGGPPAGTGPVVIPPTPPKDLLLTPPRDAQPSSLRGNEPPQVSAPETTPGLSLRDVVPGGPTLPAAATGGPVLPATPVSRFRPQ
jgi:hypothetical protein